MSFTSLDIGWPNLFYTLSISWPSVKFISSFVSGFHAITASSQPSPAQSSSNYTHENLINQDVNATQWKINDKTYMNLDVDIWEILMMK